MSINYNSNIAFFKNSSAKNDEKIEAGVLTKPIETVQKTLEDSADIFMSTIDPNESEDKKKNRKKAIAAGSVVLVLSGLTMLINPRSSGKILQRFKSWQQKLDLKIEHSKNSFLKSKVFALGKKGIGLLENSTNVYYNFNTWKDTMFKSFCTNSNKNYPKFIAENKMLKGIVQKADEFFVKILNKPHKAITKFFDGISRKTVENNYSSALKKMEKFEANLKVLREKLPEEKKSIIDSKLAEIAEAKKAFSESSLNQRLQIQEDSMHNIEADFWQKLNWENSTKFLARDILKNQKEQGENAGAKLVEKLVGSKNTKGLYDEVLEVFQDNLSKEEHKLLENNLKSVTNKLKKANQSECCDYFDKKRDLMSGGAPTDVVTQIIGLGTCGYAVGSADKEDRVSKLVTNGIPIITGLASSLIFSALLFSGPIGLLAGLGVTGVTTTICGLIDKYLLGNNHSKDKNDVKSNMEAVSV